jgi:hypothetical protein
VEGRFDPSPGRSAGGVESVKKLLGLVIFPARLEKITAGGL